MIFDLYKEKYYKHFLVLSIFLFISCCGFKLYLSNSLAIKNSQLKDLFDRKSQLEKEVTLLSYEDSVLSSMKEIEIRANQLGFVPMKEKLISLDPESLAKVNSLSQR